MRKRTIAFKRHLLAVLALFVIPMFFCLFFYNYYTIRTINDEVAEAGSNTIDLYRSKIEYDLQSLSLTVADYWANDYAHGNLVNRVDELTRHLSGYDIGVKYRSLLAMNESLGGIAIISEKNQLNRYYFRERSYSLEEQREIKAVAQEWLSDPSIHTSKGWQPVRIMDKGFLMRILGHGGGYTVLLVDLYEIIGEQLKRRQSDEGFLFFLTSEGDALIEREGFRSGELLLECFGEDYYLSARQPRYMVINQYSDMMNTYILYLIPYKGYFSYMNGMQALFLCISILMILCIPAGYLVISRYYFRPMEALLRTMKKIRDGNLDERSEENYRIEEFQEFSWTFNQMITEIQNLKVESWERERQKNRAELQHLQLQLRPHFFLNCLKNLYGMAEVKRYDKMQDMILQVSKHLRYFFKDNTSLVLLEEEMDHVINYVSLQKESMGQDVDLELDIEEGMKECMIPVLLLQTFVENSFKYGRRANKQLLISIRIIGLQMEDNMLMDIIITDNGTGFEPEILEQLSMNMDRPAEDHVGITNIRQRLQLIYGESAVMQCVNLEEGAQIEMILPVDLGKKSQRLR